MAKIIVRLKQLDTEELLTECLPTRSPGWAKNSRSLLIVQDNGAGVPDGTFVIPSTVGDGQGRRLTSTAHGLSVGQPLRLHVVSGTARFDLAISSTDKSMLATHVVTRVVDADTFDVAQCGAWDIPGLAVGDLYLSDVTPGVLTATPPTAHPAQRIGVYDGSALHLTIAPPGGDAINLDTLVEELNARGDLTAVPKGSAGGDLDGSYANPVVAQVTGVGAALRSIDTDISYTPETREETDLHANGGRGICPGKHYRTILGVQTEESCWCVSDEYGEAFWSHDYLKSTVKDTSIRTAGPAAYGSTADQVYRWGTRRFVYMGGAINSWAWITGCGRTNGAGSNGAPGIFYAKHEPASYAADGSMLSTAWHYLAWDTINPNGLNKASAHNGTLCWEGDSQYIVRTSTFSAGGYQTVADGGSSSYRFAGLSNDSYGVWGAVSQWGDLWKSVPVGGLEGTEFTKLSSINVSYDGGKTFSAAAKLPGGSGVCRWSGLLCCYGLWLAIVFEPGSSGYSYAYSEDFENWIVYSGATLPAFYDASNDGVRWFATNKMSTEAGASAVPSVYQLLVDAVNVKRRLNLENGAAIAGPLFVLDMQDAVAFGSDENGKLVPRSSFAALGGKLDDLTDVDTSTTSPTDGQVLKYNASSGLWIPGNSGDSEISVLVSESFSWASRDQFTPPDTTAVFCELRCVGATLVSVEAPNGEACQVYKNGASAPLPLTGLVASDSIQVAYHPTTALWGCAPAHAVGPRSYLGGYGGFSHTPSSAWPAGPLTDSASLNILPYIQATWSN